ncbi:MAG: LysM peptidoglycan-binding domain-containing protein [Patescibacteria group bacterium]|nr:LysM peptidoglycan-binding domain-containing protein [Patescibacteria group bacterium]
MRSELFLKIKINFILRLVNLFKKIGFFIFWFLEKTLQGFTNFLFFLAKIILSLFFSLYLKTKKLIKEVSLNFHYQDKLFSFVSHFQSKIILIFLIFVFVFIISEQKIIPEKMLSVQASVSFAKETEENEATSPDFKIATVEDEESVLIPNFTFERDFVPTRTEIEKYIVQPGDTISSIAEDFEVSVNTILWENKLTPRSIIRPGQILKILPISGVSHQVKRGETIEKIARYYKANQEDIISFNDLEEKPLVAGEIIIIPEGKIPPPVIPRTVTRSVRDKLWPGQLGQRTREGTNCRDFYPGQCTWYVAQKYCIPWSGHAKSWLANAKKFGFSTGLEPVKGAIVSLRETWYGHVGIVEEVGEDSIIISEMNHLGPWKVNKREIKKDDWRINGYIYLK